MTIYIYTHIGISTAKSQQKTPKMLSQRSDLEKIMVALAILRSTPAGLMIFIYTWLMMVNDG